jgi:hypothetical protein
VSDTVSGLEWITVKVIDGDLNVEAIVIGSWAATRVIVIRDDERWLSADRWRVTHVPTGRAVGCGALGIGVSLSDAVAVARALDARFPDGHRPTASERADVEAIVMVACPP